MDLYLVLIMFLSLIMFSILLTGFIRQISIKVRFYDIPNQRSSHDTPTPKGGGISIVLTVLVCVSLLFLYKNIDLNLYVSIFIGVSIVSVTGFIDDYKNLSVITRAVLYSVASFISLYAIGGFSTVSIVNYQVDLGWVGFCLAVLFIVWLTNLYNFMDGTDGLAGVQTIFVSIFCIILLYFSHEFPLSVILLCLASSTIGFLYWNWSPAKIFMGDVGSCTIGFLFGYLAIYSEKNGVISITIWLILLSPFFGDATFTLLNRMLRKEKWYKAHNSHAYQKIYQLGISHHRLACGLIIFQLAIVWPIAYIAHRYKIYEFMMLVLVYLIIGIIWWIVQKKHKKLSY